MVAGPRRLLITGSAGSGKTTLAAMLSARLGVLHIELDELFHGPGWTRPDPADFRSRVATFVAGPSWVVDGNYRVVKDIVRDRAELLIALDLPRLVVMRNCCAGRESDCSLARNCGTATAKTGGTC